MTMGAVAGTQTGARGALRIRASRTRTKRMSSDRVGPSAAPVTINCAAHPNATASEGFAP